MTRFLNSKKQPAFVFAILLCMVCGTGVWAQNSNVNRHVILIGGLGGSAEHTEKFKQYLFNTRKAFVDGFQVPAEQVVVLGETSIEPENYVDLISNAENIRAQFAQLKAKVSQSDQVFVVLFGHGGYDGGEARLNIPRRDLTQQDYATLIGELQAGRIVFINTSSASAPFVEALSGDNRVVVTATRTGTQKNETVFPRFVVESLTSPAADRDKDGRISVLEMYQYAAEKTEQLFNDNNNIATENALLDDNGDQAGSRLSELADGKDGHLAGITYFADRTPLLAGNAAPTGASSGWLAEREQIEAEIAAAKSRKSELDTEEYYGLLETLFVKLARGNEASEQGQ